MVVIGRLGWCGGGLAKGDSGGGWSGWGGGSDFGWGGVEMKVEKKFEEEEDLRAIWTFHNI